MKITQLSKHVFKCQFKINVPIQIPLNIWLIEHEGDIYIVDTGVEGLVHGLQRLDIHIRQERHHEQGPRLPARQGRLGRARPAGRH